MRPSRFLLALCSALLLLPQLALAEGDNTNLKSGPVHIITPEPVASPRPTPFPIPTPKPLDVPVASPLPEKFCTNLTTVDTMIGDTTGSRYNQLQSDFTKQSGQIQTNLSNLDQKLAGARAEADSKRHQDFADLTAKAATPAEQQAIAMFETTVNQAINTERAAVDAANKAFVQGLLSAISDRRADLAAASANYKTAVTTALATAKASCEGGTDPATVRSTLQAALQAARANFETALQNADQSSPDLSTLKATRQSAVTAANAAFKATVQQALATLKAALGTSASPTPTPTP
jgi:hypothetical protein